MEEGWDVVTPYVLIILDVAFLFMFDYSFYYFLKKYQIFCYDLMYH
jgi:hypothetical protein